MVESITLGDLSGWATAIVGLVGGLGTLWVMVRKGVKSAIKPELDELKEIVTDTAKCNAGNFVKNFLSDLDRGLEMSQIEYEAYYNNLKVYERYGGNDYIHKWAKRLEKEGKFKLGDPQA